MSEKVVLVLDGVLLKRTSLLDSFTILLPFSQYSYLPPNSIVHPQNKNILDTCLELKQQNARVLITTVDHNHALQANQLGIEVIMYQNDKQLIQSILSTVLFPLL